MRLTRLTDAWVNRPRYDYPLTLVATTAAVLANPRNLLLSEQHGDWYQTLATVTGALVGVASVAITLVLTVAPNERLERVLRQVGPNLGRVVMSCVGGLIIATGGFAMLFLLETGTHRTRVGATAMLVTFTLLRFARLWRVFLAVITVLTTPASSQQSEGKQTTWKRPVVDREHYALPRRRTRRVPPSR